MKKLHLSLSVVLLWSNLAVADPIIPDPTLTPGDVLTSDLTLLCRPGYAHTVRHVSGSLKRKVYREYGIVSHRRGTYEVDHLLSLELGGSNSIRNLWPESYHTKPLNAHTKDKLENTLHRLVCSGKLPIEQAQHDIATDWIGAYRQYVKSP